MKALVEQGFYNALLQSVGLKFRHWEIINRRASLSIYAD